MPGLVKALPTAVYGSSESPIRKSDNGDELGNCEFYGTLTLTAVGTSQTLVKFKGKCWTTFTDSGDIIHFSLQLRQADGSYNWTYDPTDKNFDWKSNVLTTRTVVSGGIGGVHVPIKTGPIHVDFVFEETIDRPVDFFKIAALWARG